VQQPLQLIVEGYSGPVQFRLFSINGVSVAEQVVAAGTTESIDLSALPRGVYVIELRPSDSKSAAVRQRIVIQ
jgi:hypothetical protein